MKKATYSEEQSRPRKADDNTKPPTKTARILTVFMAGSSLNRFEAELIGDHCLHSTVSALANIHGLVFERKQERVPNHWGKPCTVTRYQLPESQRELGHKVLRKLARTQTDSEE